MTDFNQRADRERPETHGTAVGTRAAIVETKPNRIAPRALSKNHGRKSVRVATSNAKPRTESPPEPSSNHSRKAASPANRDAKPNMRAPGTSSTKRGLHSPSDTHGNCATARPAKASLKPNADTPGDSFPSGRKTGRRSTARTKAKRTSSGDNSEGQRGRETQKLAALDGRASLALKPNGQAPGHSLRDGQALSDTHAATAVAGDDHVQSETQFTTVIATIQELWRRRQSWHRAEKSLTLQCKAVCRRFVGGDKIEANKLFAAVAGHTTRAEAIEDQPVTVAILPLMMARETVEKHRDAVEKELAKLAISLPIYPWIEAIPGIAAGSLAALVGECGDIGSYKSASAVWKRMGLAVINGGRQRRVEGPDALEHGYSPKRRSVAWNIGGGLIGGMGKGPRPKVGEDIEARDDLSVYQKQFVRLLRLEVERVTETWNGPEHKREPVEKKGELYESFSSHAANRIKRRIEKQFLAELYGEWRSMNRVMP